LPRVSGGGWCLKNRRFRCRRPMAGEAGATLPCRRRSRSAGLGVAMTWVPGFGVALVCHKAWGLPEYVVDGADSSGGRE
jgi:hypothetical protein